MTRNHRMLGLASLVTAVLGMAVIVNGQQPIYSLSDLSSSSDAATSSASAPASSSVDASYAALGGSKACDAACGCDSACDGKCGVVDPCGCDKGGKWGVADPCGCDNGCDDGCGCSCYLFGPDEAIELFPTTCSGIKLGGWFQFGYTTYNNSMFNNHPDHFDLHQAWVYAEKVADGSEGFDWGFRADYVYGTDGPDTQAFGGPPNSWDNQWDDGGFYGRALPQAYVEAAYGNLSVKAGHFFTIIGYEVVTAPDNFFYSHAYTMFNAEPFTHTGVLGTYALADGIEVYGGWIQGWDTGFSSSGGDGLLGGLSLGLTDDASIIYALTAGNRTLGDKGYGHSVVFDWNLTERLNYVFQSDFNTYTNLKTFGINNYFFYSLNDCVAIGTRMEWWRTRNAANDNADLYELTAGLNIRPHANLVIRPEIRWDWDKDGVLINPGDNDRLGFGVDVITTW